MGPFLKQYSQTINRYLWYVKIGNLHYYLDARNPLDNFHLEKWLDARLSSWRVTPTPHPTTLEPKMSELSVKTQRII